MTANNTGHVGKLLELKSRFLMPCIYHFYKEPMVLVRGKGCRVYDSARRSYIDCYSGVGVTNCGHGQGEILKAVKQQLDALVHTTTIYLTEPMLHLAEALSDFIPGDLSRSFFCTSGSEANEGALLLAKLTTGRTDFMALSLALHGRTWLTGGVTGMAFWRVDPAPPGNVHFAPSPACGDCPLKLNYPDCGLRCADAVEDIARATKNRIAAFICEPVHGNGGIIVPPPGYFERVQEILRRHGILLIVDEAQTGFCRTGHRFGHENWDVSPDIMTVCKALGNGLPIAAFVATDGVAARYNKPGASTFGGNLVCATAALASLRFMIENELEQRAAASGRYLRERLDSLAGEYDLVGEVRGLGLMLGMELITDDGGPAGETADKVLELLKDYGVLAGKTGPGRNVLTFMPPLTISHEEIDIVVSALEAALVHTGTMAGAGHA